MAGMLILRANVLHHLSPGIARNILHQHAASNENIGKRAACAVNGIDIARSLRRRSIAAACSNNGVRACIVIAAKGLRVNASCASIPAEMSTKSSGVREISHGPASWRHGSSPL